MNKELRGFKRQEKDRIKNLVAAFGVCIQAIIDAEPYVNDRAYAAMLSHTTTAGLIAEAFLEGVERREKLTK